MFPLRPAASFQHKPGVKPGTVENSDKAIKVKLMFFADLFQACVLVKIEVEKLANRAPVVADVFPAFLLAMIDLSDLAQHEITVVVVLIAGRRNAAIKPSCFLFGLDPALHARDDLFLFLGGDDAQK